LRQTFPLGRFHATPWRASPFDDPYGEWPPSPWRLVRAVAARWHQWRREVGDQAAEQGLDTLVHALCTSTFSFWLPANARRGTALRFYQPTDWGWWPAAAKSAGARSYRQTLVRDNYWAIPPNAELLWFLDGPDWSSDLFEALDRCLERITYLGRAESFTEITRLQVPPDLESNVTLHDAMLDQDAVPVLAPKPDATLADIHRTTDDARLLTVPPGARWRYALRPPQPPARHEPRPPSTDSAHLVQFAIGSAVAPEPRVVCHLTGRFRGSLLRQAAQARLDAPGLKAPSSTGWQRLPEAVRCELALLAGKDVGGQALKGHQHLRLAVWFEGGRPARLLAWRHPEPFTDWEMEALHRAADRDLTWQSPGRGGAPAWTVRLVPMDGAVTPPPGFDGRLARVWESVTPYVPPRHRVRSHGRARSGEDVPSQVTRELLQLGVLTGEELPTVEFQGGAEEEARRWTAVRLPPSARRGQRFTGDKLGFLVRLTFPRPVPGPLTIGQSSHYGLGLFQPIQTAAD
jgi:CRISPR-associated protein Csb2